MTAAISPQRETGRPPWWYRTLGTLMEPIAAGWGQQGDSQQEAWRKGRAGSPRDFWVHAASVGEVAGAIPLLKTLRSERSSHEFLLTAMTAGGRRRWQEAFPRDPIGAPPFDSPGAVARALNRIQPQHLLLFETEIWPLFLSRAIERRTRVAIVNARLSDRNWSRYQLLRPALRPTLRHLTAVAAQTAIDAERWVELGVSEDRVAVTGNSKFDDEIGAHRLGTVEESRARAREQLGLPTDGPLVLWASLRPGEERWLESVCSELGDAAPLMGVVPRHPDQWRDSVMKRSPSNVHWIPKLGILPTAYQAADLVVMGGTLEPYGGHNPAEPALLGLPVLLGPSVQNVRPAAAALLEYGGARLVGSPDSLAIGIQEWTQNDSSRREAGEAAERSIHSLRGASRRSLDWLQKMGFWDS